MTVIAYIGFGANLGNPVLKFDEAVHELDSIDGVRLIKKSSLYETRPVGLVDGGPNFVNAVLVVETDVSAEVMINEMRGIERKLGKSTNHRSDLSRVIDLDLLFYGSEIIDSDDLVVPHPRLMHRFFVLGPMAEVAADFVHPIEKKSMKELLEMIGPEEQKPLKPVSRN